MLKVVCTYHKLMEKLKELVHYWKIESGNVDEDDPRGIQINETKGECKLKGRLQIVLH
jgi:hypothetical protein